MQTKHLLISPISVAFYLWLLVSGNFLIVLPILLAHWGAAGLSANVVRRKVRLGVTG